MKILTTTSYLLAAGVATLVLLPSAPSAESSRFQNLTPGSQAYFRSGPVRHAPPPSAPPTRGPSLPNSTLPENPDALCSVAASEPVVNFCSVLQGTPTNMCSTQCGTELGCSVIGVPGSPLSFYACSTLDSNAPARCSVLQPSAGTDTAGCSVAADADSGVELLCSVSGPRSRKAACSAANPGGINSHCSSFNTTPESQCSVFNQSTNDRGFCSTGFAESAGGVSKQCSTFSSTSPCSVTAGGNAGCTAFKMAPAGSCSSFSGSPSGCSVIGGPDGTQCFQP